MLVTTLFPENSAFVISPYRGMYSPNTFGEKKICLRKCVKGVLKTKQNKNKTSIGSGLLYFPASFWILELKNQECSETMDGHSHREQDQPSLAHSGHHYRPSHVVGSTLSLLLFLYRKRKTQQINNLTKSLKNLYECQICNTFS